MSSSASSNRAFIAEWKAYLKHLESFSFDPAQAAVTEAAAKQLVLCQKKVAKGRGITDIHASPQTWEKLVLQFQVPLQLASACSKLAQHQPKSTAVYVTMALLHDFSLDFAMDVLGVSEPFSGRDSGAAPAAPSCSSRLQAAFVQQLQQSELLQQMPGLLAAAAEELEALITRMQQQQQDSQALASCCSMEAYHGRGDQHQGSTLYQYAVMHHATALLGFVHLATEVGLWPDKSTCVSHTVAMAPTATRLVVAVMQHVSVHTQHLESAAWQDDSSREGLLGMAMEAAGRAGASMFIFLENAADIVLILLTPGGAGGNKTAAGTRSGALLSDLLPCTALLCALLVLGCSITEAQAVAPRAAATASSAASDKATSRLARSSQSCSSKARSGRQQPAAAATATPASGNCQTPLQRIHGKWQVGCRMLRQGLPSSCTELFKLLNVDGRVMLWAAAMLDIKPGHTGVITASLPSFGQLYAKGVRLAATNAAQFSNMEPQQQAALAQVYRMQALLPALLLQTAAASTGKQRTQWCEAAITCTAFVLSVWQDAQTAKISSSRQCAGVTATATAPGAAAHPWLRQHYIQGLVAAELWFGTVLPLLFQVCRMFLGQLQQPLGSLAAAAPSPFTDRVHKGLALLQIVVEQLGIFVNGSDPGSSTVSGTGAADYKQRIAGVATELLALLDGVVRMVTAAAAAGALKESEVETLQAKGRALAMCLLQHARKGGISERNQLYSLLFSMQKQSSAAAYSTSQAVLSSATAAYAANQCLLTWAQVEAVGASQTSAGGSASGAESGVAASGFDSAVPQQYLQNRALWSLPSLAVIGRCFLQCAQRLATVEIPDIMSALQQRRAGRPMDRYGLAAGAFCFGTSMTPSYPPDCSTALQHTLHDLQSWLQQPSASAQLADAGYKPHAWLQQLTQLLRARRAAADSMTADTLTALAEQLQAAGQALTSVAIPVACNNAWCSNVSGPTELQLVSGRSCVCAGCLTARYCSRSCQKQAWKQHKPVCEALKHAQEAAAAAAAAAKASDAI